MVGNDLSGPQVQPQPNTTVPITTSLSSTSSQFWSTSRDNDPTTPWAKEEERNPKQDIDMH